MKEHGSDIPTWLRKAASSFEGVAEGGVPENRRRRAEGGNLQQLVDFASDRLALLRLNNLRESLADVESILDSLKHELEVRRSDGRSIRLTEQLVWEAEQERARLLGQISSAVDVPGIPPSRRREAASRESFEPIDDRDRISRHFARFYRPSQESFEDYDYRSRSDVRRYRDESFEREEAEYYRRSLESRRPSPSRERSSEAPKFEISRGGRRVQDPERSRSAERPAWLSVRVERKTRPAPPSAELRLGRKTADPAAAPTRKSAPVRLSRPPNRAADREEKRTQPGLSWLSGSGKRPEAKAKVEATAEDLPTITAEEEALLEENALLVDVLDSGQLDAEMAELEDLDLDDLDLGDLGDLEGLDLDDLEALGDDLDVDDELLDLDLDDPELSLDLDLDDAELLDDELAEPFLDEDDLEIEEEFALAPEPDEIAEEPEVVADLVETDSVSVDEPLALESELEPAVDELAGLDDLDLGELEDLGELDDLELGDLEDIDLDDLDLGDLDGLDLEDLGDIDLADLDLTAEEGALELDVDGLDEALEIEETEAVVDELVDDELGAPELEALDPDLEQSIAVEPEVSEVVPHVEVDLAPEVLVDEPVGIEAEVVEATDAPVVSEPELLEEPVAIESEVVESIEEPVGVEPERVEEPVTVEPEVVGPIEEPNAVEPHVVEAIEEPVTVEAELIEEPVAAEPEIVAAIEEPVAVEAELIEEPVAVEPDVVEVIDEPGAVEAELTEEPVAVEADVVEAIEEPVAVELDVVAAIEEPVAVEAELIEEPVAVEPEAVEALEEPVAVEAELIEEPIAVEPEAVEALEEPVAVEAELIEEPVAAEPEIVEAIEEPVAVEAELIEEPVAVEPEAVGAIEEPVAVEAELIEEPVAVEPEVVEAIEEPVAVEAELIEEPVAVEPEVVEAIEEPVAVEAELVEEPIAVEPEVVEAIEEPVAVEAELIDEPVAVEPEVVEAVEEPVAVEAELIEEPVAVEPEVVEAIEEPVAVEPEPIEEPVAVEPEVVEAMEDLEPSGADATQPDSMESVFEGPVAQDGADDFFGAEPAVVEELPELEAPPVEAAGSLELIDDSSEVSSGFFDEPSLSGAPTFLDADDLFASGEMAATTEASIDDDLFTGSGELQLEDSEFFSGELEGDPNWLNEPLAESVDAPEWLKSPDDVMDPVADAPMLESVEAAVEEAAAPEVVDVPAPATETPIPTAPPADSGASAQERRRLVRLSCNYDTTAYFEGRPVPVKLLDISLGGGKLLTPSGLQRGQLIQLSNPLPEAKTNDPVTARIVWMRASKEQDTRFDAGLQFEESPEVLGKSWVISVLNKIGMQSKVFNQRKYTRAVANLPIEVDLATKERIPGTALDLGLGGALLAVDRPMSPTTRFTLHIGPLGNHEKLELRCEIISSRHDEEGAGWTHSAKFSEISSTQTKLLGKYVVDLLKTGGSV